MSISAIRVSTVPTNITQEIYREPYRKNKDICFPLKAISNIYHLFLHAPFQTNIVVRLLDLPELVRRNLTLHIGRFARQAVGVVFLGQ